jgi:hypothetical protein
MEGKLYGGSTPIVGAALTLYVTTSNGYGATASAVATATTVGGGAFLFTLPTGSAICPTGEFAYVASVGGNTGAGTNTTAVLMTPIGSCDSNYTYSSGTGKNAYTGPSLFINEVTTAVSAYALGNFMTVTNSGKVNIGAPANNTATSSTTSAAGLSHAFANALSILNLSTGQPYAFAGNAASAAAGAVIPDAEILTLGNILQACVNTAGPTTTSTATANDGTPCGELFSFVTPPQTGATVPSNLLQAALDLAKYPNPSVNTWNSTCTAAGAGTKTATTCLYDLSPTQAAYAGGLSAAPPDWSLALVYSSGYGSGTGPGLTYPTYVALDYQDNVYILNDDASTPTRTNIIALKNNGTPIFSTAADTTHKSIRQIGTDTAGHVFGGDPATNAALIYSTADGSLTATVTSTTVSGVTTSLSAPSFTIADPFNNIYVGSSGSGTNLRFISSGTFAVKNLGTGAEAGNGTAAIAFDSNLDLYVLEANNPAQVNFLYNSTTNTAAPTLGAETSGTTAALTGSTGSSYGLVATGGNNAFVVDASVLTPITRSSSTSISAGTAISIPGRPMGMTTEPFTPRYMAIDGNGWLYTPDYANASAVTGVVVYDTADSILLGPYEGCAVVGTTSPACATSAAISQVPFYSPRAIAIDSSGDIWVPNASSSSALVTELIGAAAPTWPALSTVKFGLPQ